MIIHLKRFDGNIKLKNKIIFPLENLKISKYTSNIDENKNLNYNLIGVINHYGTMNFGHYICYVKNTNNNNWYLFNDSFIKRIDDINLIVSKEAYILIYKRDIDILNVKSLFKYESH